MEIHLSVHLSAQGAAINKHRTDIGQKMGKGKENRKKKRKKSERKGKKIKGGKSKRIKIHRVISN